MTSRTRPVHVGSIALPFAPCVDDYMDVINGGRQLVLLDASEGLFYVVDALAPITDWETNTFAVDAPPQPRRFAATEHSTLLIAGECVANLWEVCLMEETGLSGAEVRVLYTDGVPTAITYREGVIVVAVRTTTLATSIKGLCYADGSVLFSFPVGLGMMITAVEPTSEGYIMAVHTSRVTVYCADGSLILTMGGDRIGRAGDGCLLHTGHVAVADWATNCIHIFSSSTGGLLHTVKSRKHAVSPFALSVYGARVYVMYADSPAVHVLE